MESISLTVMIDISRTPGKIENVHINADCLPEEILIYTELFKEFRDVFAWSYEEMPGIDPRIVEHEIRTYIDAKPVRQHLRAVNPQKSPAIKADGFSGYNKIKIKPEDQHKMTFICPWGTFAHCKMPFGLKNVGATFQCAMAFASHDLKHIVEAYLDDLCSLFLRDMNIHWTPKYP